MTTRLHHLSLVATFVALGVLAAACGGDGTSTSGPATTAIVSGETQFLVGSPAAVVTQLDAKRLRLLAVSSDTRLSHVPHTPTVAEAGGPGCEFRGWVGVWERARPPRTSAPQHLRLGAVSLSRPSWSSPPVRTPRDGHYAGLGGLGAARLPYSATQARAFSGEVW